MALAQANDHEYPSYWAHLSQQFPGASADDALPGVSRLMAETPPRGLLPGHTRTWYHEFLSAIAESRGFPTFAPMSLTPGDQLLTPNGSWNSRPAAGCRLNFSHKLRLGCRLGP